VRPEKAKNQPSRRTFLDIAGGAADDIAALGGLYPARLLAQQCSNHCWRRLASTLASTPNTSMRETSRATPI